MSANVSRSKALGSTRAKLHWWQQLLGPRVAPYLFISPFFIIFLIILGLVIDLGQKVRPQEMTVRLTGSSTSFTVYASDQADPDSVDGLEKLGAKSDAGERSRVELSTETPTRYLVLWLTRLPEVSGGFRGQGSDIARHAEDILKTKKKLNEIYSNHTGKPVEQIEAALDRDNFLSAEESLAFGLVDHVYEKREVAETDGVKT